MTAKVVEISIAEVKVSETRRAIGDVTDLMNSIQDVGLLQPIVVSKGFALVAGRHRLEACRRLGWKRIPATVKDYDAIDIQIAELDENLLRNELSILERCEHLSKRKVLYERKHPETRKGNTTKRAEVKRNKFVLLPSFSASTATKLRVTPRTVQLSIKLVSDLPKDVRDLIRGTIVGDSRKELIKLSGYDHLTQKKIAKQISTGAATSIGRALSIVKHDVSKVLNDPLTDFNEVIGDLWSVMDRARQYGEFQRLFDKCSDEVADSFLQRLGQIHEELGDWIFYLGKRTRKKAV